MPSETTSSTTDGSELPRFGQLTVDRSMAHFLATLIGIGRAIHDEDEGRWVNRSNLLQMMLWSDIELPGGPLDHDAFHKLETGAFELLKATDPVAYQEAFGGQRIPDEPDESGEQSDILSILQQLIGSKAVIKLEPKEGEGPAESGHPPKSKRTREGGDGGPAKKARKRRRKDGT